MQVSQAAWCRAAGIRFEKSEISVRPSFNVHEMSAVRARRRIRSRLAPHAYRGVVDIGQFRLVVGQLTAFLQAPNRAAELVHHGTLLGIPQQALGNETATLEAFERAIACDSTYGEAYSNLSVVLERSGDIERAQQYRAKA